jgi:predicted GTPase
VNRTHDDRRIIIVGAAGRDFHNFNVVFRDDPATTVVAFTASQIPGIEDRRYPAALAGVRYPTGIPIYAEDRLEVLCRDEDVDEVIFAYSDVPHEAVMHVASRALSAGADFSILGPEQTMLAAAVPVVAVSAVRTGCGKSQVARWICTQLRDRGHRVAAIRHPMPYGVLAEQRVQRFATREDLDRANCTVEEREEYEPHIAAGIVVFAGVDYEAILRMAEEECDVIVWDGGNNDFPFVRPTLHLVVMDALRPGQASAYHPGEAVARMADVIIINKVDAAPAGDVEQVALEATALNATAAIVRAASPVQLDDEDAVRGKRCLVVEDGPTITHGGMSYGAGYTAAQSVGAETIDPRISAVPDIRAVYDRYPHIGNVLPAVGYSADQIAALEETINASSADVVVAATPIDLASIAKIKKPIVRARYGYADAGDPTLSAVLEAFLNDLT